MTFVWLHCLGYQNEHGSEGVSEHLESTAGQDKLKTWERGTILDFKPERWLDSQGEFDPHAGPYLPFSHGVRACFGKSLAVSQRFLLSSLTDGRLLMFLRMHSLPNCDTQWRLLIKPSSLRVLRRSKRL